MILDKIAADTKLRVNKAKRKIPFSQMRAMAYEKEKNTGFPFEKMLKEPGMRSSRSRSYLVLNRAKTFPREKRIFAGNRKRSNHSGSEKGLYGR